MELPYIAIQGQTMQDDYSCLPDFTVALPLKFQHAESYKVIGDKSNTCHNCNCGKLTNFHGLNFHCSCKQPQNA